MKKTSTAGILLFRAKNKLIVLFKARKVTRTTASGDTEEVWLGTSSNKASMIVPKTVSKDIIKNVLVPVNKDELPEGISLPVGMTDINKDDPLLQGFFHNNDGTPYDDDTKVVVRLSAASPFPYGHVPKTGILDQAAFDCLEAIDPNYLPFWAQAMNNHDEDFQNLLLSGDASLRQYLPAQPPTGHSYVDKPFFTLDQIDEDDELINLSVEELHEECEKIASNNMARATDSQSAPSSAPAASIEIVTPNPVQEQLKPAAKPAYTESDYQRARIIAFGIHYDPATGKLTPPEITDFYGAIMEMNSKKDQRDSVKNTLESVEDSLTQSSNFLYRAMDCPQLSNIASSFLGQGLMSSDPVTSLDINTSNGFVLNMIMPDTAAMAKEKAEAADLNYAEEAMGEHHSKKSKLDTTFTSIKEIGGLNSFLTIMANGMGVEHLLYKFDVESTAPIPSAAHYIYKLAYQMTSKRARKWLKDNRPENQQLFYYVLNQVLAILACFGQASKDVLVTTGILSKSLDTCPKTQFRTAHRIYESTVECLERVMLNSQEVPQSALWQNAPAKKRQDEKEMKKFADLVSPRGNNKKDTS